MIWARMLACITGTVDQELLLRNEYLAAENRILRAQIKGRLLLCDAEKATLAEIAHRLRRKALEYRRLQSMLLTQIRKRHIIEQVPPEDGNLLFRSVVLSLFSHASSPPS
jgi:hypothetical protein